MRRALIATLAAAGVISVGLAAYGRAQEAAGIPHHALTFGLAVTGYGEVTDGHVPGRVGASTALSDAAFVRLMGLSGNPTCLMSAGEPPSPGEIEWSIEARLVAGSEDGATIDLQWSRTVKNAASIFDAESITESRRLVLSHQEWVPLDLVRVPDHVDNPCRRLVVAIRTQIHPDPALEDAVLRYDSWLVHREGSGRPITEHIRNVGRQDAKIDYLFAPRHYDAQGPKSADFSAAALTAEISGTLRGRARPDGLIDLTLTTWRRVYDRDALANRSTSFTLTYQAGPGPAAIVEQDSRGILGSGGVKQLTVRSGETIEVALPPPSGRLNAYELSDIFAGHSTALRITTTRVR